MIWRKKHGGILPPIRIGLLKERIKNRYCIQITWGYTLDKSSDIVKDVLNDSNNKEMFVYLLKKQIKNYRLDFISKDKSIEGINITYTHPISWMTKEILQGKLKELELHYAKVIMCLEVASGRP
jgi:hypothetical protein